MPDTSHPGRSDCTGIFHTSAKSPGQARGPAGRTNPRSPATIPPPVRWPAEFPAKREATRGHPQAPGAPHHIPGHPGSDPPARLMTLIDPRDTRATCHRPPRDPRRHQMQASPNDHAGHPILLDMEAIVRGRGFGRRLAAGTPADSVKKSPEVAWGPGSVAPPAANRRPPRSFRPTAAPPPRRPHPRQRSRRGAPWTR